MTDIKAKDRGSAVLVQVEFKKQAPYGTLDYFDPVAPKISVIDPAGNLKVTDADLTKKDALVGKYFYICQTGVDWPVGVYSTKATGGDGTYADVTVNSETFKLK